MQSLNEVVFVDSLPKLDLHEYDCASAKVAILDFIKDCYQLKQDVFLIIHGIGSGAVKNITHETLRKHKLVLEYKLYYYNTGCTLVRIDVGSPEKENDM